MARIDPKLYHLVKKLMPTTHADNQGNGGYTSPSEDLVAGNKSSGNACSDSSVRKSNVVRRNNGTKGNSAAVVTEIVRSLRTHHREYQRKDSSWLISQVEAAVRQIQLASAATSSAGSAARCSHQSPSVTSSGVRKRKNRERISSRRHGDDGGNESDEDKASDDDAGIRLSNHNDDDDDEARYEEGALLHDALQEQRASSAPGGGGGLNAALRSRYLAIADERRLATSAALVSAATENGDDEKGASMDGALPQQQPSMSTAGDASKSSKVKRRGARAIRRASSLANSGNSESSDCAFLQPVCPSPPERYSDLGGIDRIIQELRELVEYPLQRPELYRHLGIDPPRGVLLRGPPGVGKTHVANAGELQIPYFRVSAPELVSGMSGESEGRIRDLFKVASDSAPALIFLDEIDAIAPKRGDGGGSGGNRGMEKRMVAQLLTCLDMLAPQNNRDGAPVLVLAATNRPDSLDAALRRAGRFDKEIFLGVPDEDAREHILRTMTSSIRLAGNFDYKLLARKTPGFVGADVQSLAKEAAILAINRICRDVLDGGAAALSEPLGSSMSSGLRLRSLAPLSPEQMDDLYVTMDDFLAAVPLVQPSSKREGFATVPDVTWQDIGALQSIRDELTISVLEPIRCPEKFRALGLSLPAGVLLYGPPGCGKTLLAKAIANESSANFISIKGPELLDKYVGESERAVRLVFERARSSSPCIVFFDELDSLVPRRGSDSGGSGVSERVVNQLLTELDGLDSRRSVFVIAATNRPELIDPAMLRPGRLDKLLYVPLPTPDDRVSILEALAKNVALDSDVNLESIGRSPKASGYSGADCAALLREAGLSVLKEDAAANEEGHKESSEVSLLRISSRHFEAAFSAVMPSVSRMDQARYDRIRDRIARARSRSEVDNAADGDDPDSMKTK